MNNHITIKEHAERALARHRLTEWSVSIDARQDLPYEQTDIKPIADPDPTLVITIADGDSSIYTTLVCRWIDRLLLDRLKGFRPNAHT